MADLRLVVFSQTGRFHDGIAVPCRSGAWYGLFSALPFCTAFLSALLEALTEAFLNTLLFELLCDGHKSISVLRHTLCQFAYKGFGVGCLACLHYIVYQRYYLR